LFRISAYFDIDPLWLRVAFALSVIFAGTGLLLYIILWVIIPEAKSPSDKLQMRGSLLPSLTSKKRERRNGSDEEAG
jgi:hypothetical protein